MPQKKPPFIGFPLFANATANNVKSSNEPLKVNYLLSKRDSSSTIHTRRRRKTESSGSRERAEAPHRQRKSSGGGRPPRPPVHGGGSSRPPRRPRPSGGGGMNLSPKMTVALLVIVAIFFVCSSLFNMIFGSDEPNSSEQITAGYPTATFAANDDFSPALPTPTAVAFNPPTHSTSVEGQTWTVMLYQDADDKVLEKDIYVDLNEAERVGSNERLNIVAQIDRYQAGYRGDGNWDGTKRFYITQDDDLEHVSSQVVQDLGEVSMASGQSLVDFVTWSIDTFPADKYILILSDHGMGWPGGWTDPEPRSNARAETPLAQALGDQLYLNELDDALGEIRSRTGIDQFELIGMDACLMAHLEVFDALAPHARYAVASQETEPALGWAYTSFLQSLKDNPDMDGAQLSQLIVNSYIDDDQRIVDDTARADLVGRGSSLNGLFGVFNAPSAEQVAQQMERGVTLSAVDLSAIPELIASVNNLSVAISNDNQQTVAQARSYAQSYTSIFGSNVPASYIDLANFTQLLKQESRNSEVSAAADSVLNSINHAIIAEKHGSKKSGSNGVSIYFPNSQLYAAPAAGAESYTAIASRFATDSLWDDFLAYHYTGRKFNATARDLAVPERGTSVTAPGTGNIQVSPLQLSSDTASPGHPVTLSADVQGENIGYIKLFVGFYDQASNSIFMADTDFLESRTTREVDGVYYPDWGKGDKFTVDFKWEPLMFAIDNGSESAIAMFSPETYGASAADAVYTVDGIYTYGDGGETRYARLYFTDGVLTNVFGFTGDGGAGAPREIIPTSGDSFTVLEKWMDLDAQGRVTQSTTQPGDTLTFNDQTFEWKELTAAVGNYIVGFIIEDLDGNKTEVYQQISVE